MFENLSSKLEAVFKKLRGHGKLTEENIQEALKEVRMSLLEADVNFKVVKDFIQTVQQRAIGQEVVGSLTPAQQLIKVVQEELTALMGGEGQGIHLSGSPPVPIMLVGLHGSGKTTTAGKLARYFQEKKKRPYLIPADVYRPAAIEQLQKLGQELGVDFYRPQASQTPLDISLKGREEALRKGYDLIIIDTAGRLHTKSNLMQELDKMRRVAGRKMPGAPHEVLLVIDATTGQNAIMQARMFTETVKVSGIFLAKLDGTARGGIVIAIKDMLDIPVKFVGLGEQPEDIAEFDPDEFVEALFA